MFFSPHGILQYLYKKGLILDFYIYKKIDGLTYEFKTDFESIEMFLLPFQHDHNIFLEEEHCCDYDIFVFYNYNKGNKEKLFYCRCNFFLMAIDTGYALSILQSNDKNS